MEPANAGRRTATSGECPNCGERTPGDPTFCPGCGAPRRLGKYPIRRRIGQGGMGTVYLGHHPELDRPVAIKVMNPEAAADTAAVARFRREAQVVARLNHPGVARVYDVAQEGAILYLVMEWIDGYSLGERIRCEDIPLPEAVGIARSLAQTLAHAHRMGILHRDLKPSNVMVDASGAPRLLDFGLAKILGTRTQGLTQTGQILGTPAYIAPEAINQPADRIGPSVDVYGLAAILYEMVSGTPPYQGPSAMAILRQVESLDPPPLDDVTRRAPPALAGVVARGMARDPARRFPDMEAFDRALAGLILPAGRRGRSIFPWLGAGAGACAALVLTTLVILWPMLSGNGGEVGPALPPPGKDGENGGEESPVPPPVERPPALSAMLEIQDERPERIHAWLEATADSTDPGVRADRVTALFYRGRYREAGWLAAELGDREREALAFFYGEAMPLLLAPDLLLYLGEEGLEMGANSTLRDVVANLRGRQFEVAEDLLTAFPEERVDLDVLVLRALVDLTLDRYESCEARIREALARDADYAPVLWLRAAAAGHQGRGSLIGSRRKNWRRAADPGALDSVLGEAILAAFEGNWGAARDALEGYGREGWDETASLAAAVVILHARENEWKFQPPEPGFWDELLGLARTERHPGAHLLRAECLANAVRPAEARDELLRFAERHPSWAGETDLASWHLQLYGATGELPWFESALGLLRLPFVELPQAEEILSVAAESAANAGEQARELEKASVLLRVAVRFLSGKDSAAEEDLDRLLGLGFTREALRDDPILGQFRGHIPFEEWVARKE
ncbi:MAG: protein kinase [Planctomycetes bacterium]|nr:protein kinase [Planctomycetota bacterium]